MGHVNVPEGLKEIIQQNSEKAYPQIIMEQASYPYLFHLSDIRENLIAFLPVTKQMHILERNAGCGALTGKLLSMALHVTAVVESEEEADILRVRYENAGNLTVLVVPDSDTKPETNVLYQDQVYDMILIAGEFSKFQNELSCMREHLSDNGKLYVADANRLGLKYFAGCQEEYRGGYFAGLENYDKDLLVRHQSGYQQLRKFCHEECISHSAAVHHDLPRRCGCDRCSSQKCHRSRPGCRCSNHGRLLSPDHTVCHHQKYRCTPFCVPADF